MALERTGELADGPGEGEVEEQLEPAGAPLITVVSVGGPQRRPAKMHRVTVSGAYRSTGVRREAADGVVFERGSQRAAVNAGGGHRRRFLLKFCRERHGSGCHSGVVGQLAMRACAR